MRNSSASKRRKWISSVRGLAGFVVLALALAGADSQATLPTGSMAYARYAHSEARLPDGRVLVAGGHRTSGSLSSMTTSTEIYDPATGTFAATGALAVARGEQATATLADGRVLVVGGLSWAGGTTVTLDSAEIYDPTTGTWSTTGAMTTPRRSPLALTLPNGRVLVVGGGAAIASSEIFDPATGTFTATGSLAASRGSPAAAVLADGRVLVAGGYPPTSGPFLSSAEVWDPATGAWSATGTMASARAYASATTLANGLVLVAGGNSGSAFPAAAELYDPAIGTFSTTGMLGVARQSHVAKRLPDGNVLVSGGVASTWTTESSSELYDVASGLWRPAGWMSVARQSQTLSLLPDGNVLIAGGLSGPLSSAEILYPSCIGVVGPIAPTSQSFASGGGNGSVAVNVPATCGWSVTRVTSWMTVTSGSTGMGSGTVTYTIAPKTTTGGRGTTPRIADADFSISQTGICSPTATAFLSPSSQSFAIGGGSGSIAVIHDSACAWTVGGTPAWITITSGASGQGDGTVAYTVAANAGVARSATLTIGGKNFVVSQAGTGPVCDPGAVPAISPASQSYTSTGGSGSVGVTHGAGCAWTVSGTPAWMTITAGASGTGNGTVSYTVAANTGTARSATLTIATKSFLVSQSAPAPGCTSTPLTAGTTASGSLASGDCTSGARGTSYYTDRYTFAGVAGQKISLQLSTSQFDTYLYLKNPSGTVIATNDDGGGGTNSRIPATSGYYTLPVGSDGTYTVEATSYGSWSVGAYTLLYTVY